MFINKIQILMIYTQYANGQLLKDDLIPYMEERSGEDMWKLQKNMETLDACGNVGTWKH
jgi:hypothetical protein